jgi:hypothetical protein
MPEPAVHAGLIRDEPDAFASNEVELFGKQDLDARNYRLRATVPRHHGTQQNQGK